MLKSSSVRVVPPARVDFTAEDPQWIADRIQQVLGSGCLTLGTYGENSSGASPIISVPSTVSP